MCVEIKSRYGQQYVKNPQLRTSAFYLFQHPHVHRSARPHFTIGLDGQFVTRSTRHSYFCGLMLYGGWYSHFWLYTS